MHAVTKRPFQRDVHVFRAIAILFIVGGHVQSLFRWPVDDFAHAVIKDFFTNGTVLFVFVAGYLFQYLSDRFDYRRYLRSKLRNVVLPYVVVSAPAVIHAVFIRSWADQYPQLEGTSAAYQIVWFYVKGGAHINYPLWFIPMISIYYALAPVFFAIIRRPAWYWLIVPFSGLSLFLHRNAFPHLDTIQLFFYFVSPYLVGMWTSQYRERVNVVLDRYGTWVVVAYFVWLGFQLRFASSHGIHFARDWFSTEMGVFDWPFVNKILLSFALLEVCRRTQHALYRAAKPIADLSFGIYFVHGYFMWLAPKAVGIARPDGSAPAWLAMFAVIVVASTLSCYGVRRITGRWSRMLIGC